MDGGTPIEMALDLKLSFEGWYWNQNHKHAHYLNDAEVPPQILDVQMYKKKKAWGK